MKKAIVIILILAGFNFKAQVGKLFPVIEGATLEDKPMHLPPNNGKYTVVAIAFNRGAEDELKKWLSPLFDLFAAKDEKKHAHDMTESYDVNFYFVPMINGFKKIADEFKAGTDKGYWPYIVDTKKSDISIVQKQLDVKDNKIPYFYIVDKAGKVVAAQNGTFSEDKMDALEDAISK